MTQQQTYNIGLILIALGALVFFGNFGLFNGMEGIVGSLILGSAGFLFSRAYFKNNKHIWALIIGFGFFGTAAAAISGDMAGTYFLGILGSGFALTYLQNKRHWWAIIPAGILATLAIVAGLEEAIPFFDDAIASVFFLGIAATFGALYFLPEVGKRWAVYPAIAAVGIAILATSFSGGWLLPILLVGAGAYLLKQKGDLPFSFGSNQTPSQQIHTAAENTEETRVETSSTEEDDAAAVTLEEGNSEAN